MNYTKIALAIALIFFNTPLIRACTGFCVYADNPLYGMNFDFPDVEIKFIIQAHGDMRIFHMQFESEGTFISSVGMNNKGLFCSEQEQYPLLYNSNPRRNNEIYIWELYRYALSNLHNTDQLIEYLSNRKLIHSQYPSLHLLVGDVNSKAVIVEIGNNNKITSIKNKFLVMTNFRNADFDGESSNPAYGEGVDRYKTARQYISNNIQKFDFKHGIESLKRTVQSKGGYQTLCSMLFSPGENAVYIILKRNFDKIWKLSLNQNTIETFEGFDRYSKITLNSSGILASELLRLHQ